MEWVSEIKWNHCPDWNGIGVRFALEYTARKLSRQKLGDISKEFNLGSYSSVSSAVTRTEQLLSQSKNLRKKLQKIKEYISKSQAKT